jgi:hypothetical protein
MCTTFNRGQLVEQLRAEAEALPAAGPRLSRPARSAAEHIIDLRRADGRLLPGSLGVLHGPGQHSRGKTVVPLRRLAQALLEVGHHAHRRHRAECFFPQDRHVRRPPGQHCGRVMRPGAVRYHTSGAGRDTRSERITNVGVHLVAMPPVPSGARSRSASRTRASTNASTISWRTYDALHRHADLAGVRERACRHLRARPSRVHVAIDQQRIVAAVLQHSLGTRARSPRGSHGRSPCCRHARRRPSGDRQSAWRRGIRRR